MSTASPSQRRGFPVRDPDRRLAPQDLTLTILGDYVHASRRTVWSGGLVRLLGDFGVTEAAARLALSRLARRGLIAGTKQGRLSHYELTDAGYRLLDEGHARIFGFGSPAAWDGQWTVLSFSLPEERRGDRDRLRKRLRFLGFAMLRDGTWISPRDRVGAVRAVLEALDLEQDAHVFRGAMHHGPQIAEVVARGWDLAELRARYAAYADEFGAFRTVAARRRLDDASAFTRRTLTIHEFKRFPSLDPDLPEEIVGDMEARERAFGVFEAVWGGLAEPALRHFEVTTIP